MEADFVNGVKITALCTNQVEVLSEQLRHLDMVSDDFDAILDKVDAVYIRSLPSEHYQHIKASLGKGKHVLCESPIALSTEQCKELFELAAEKNLILMEAIKTAYATAFSRLLLLIKTGKIGRVISVDSTCTSLKKVDNFINDWDGIYEWGPTALLPIFQILGTEFMDCKIVSHFRDQEKKRDSFTKIDFIYSNAVASIKVGDGVKSEGELIVSGTDGYVYVPAPWWKTDYFEVRYENPANNKRYFYQLDGEGIRYELIAFIRAIERGRAISNIDKNVTYKIADIMNDFVNRKNMFTI
jgi:choline-phosphate cytidylyltransferase